MEHKQMQNYAALFAAAVLCSVFFGSIAYYGADVPYMDDYVVVLEFLNRFQNPGADKAGLLFSQHNEHRLVFVKLAVLSARLAAGKINFTLLMYAGNFGLIFCLYFFRKIAGIKNDYIALLPIVLLLFSYVFWDTVYFGMAALQNLWVAGFSMAGLYYLTREKYATAGAFAVAAVFSSGSGLIVPFAGIIYLVFAKKFKALIFWLPAAAVVYFLYFYGYAPPKNHPDPLASFIRPLNTVLYYFSFLGSAPANLVKYSVPEAAALTLSVVSGIAAFIAVIYLSFVKYYCKNPANFLFMVFILLSGLLAALTRSGFGVIQSISSRYAFASVILFICLYISMLDLKIVDSGKKRIFVIILALAAFNLASFRLVAVHQSARKYRLIKAIYLLEKGLASPESGATALIYPDQGVATGILKESRNKGNYAFNAELSRFELKQFISTPQNPGQAAAAAGEIKFHIDEVSKVRGKSVLYINGWAFIAGGKDLNQTVYVTLTSGDKTYFLNTFIRNRPDVSAVYGSGKDDAGFYAVILPEGTVKKGEYKLGVYIKTGKSAAFADSGRKIKFE